MLPILTFFLLALSMFAPITRAIPEVSVKGSKLFAGGQQFYIKGVAYQGTPFDPLTDVAQCNADATLMATLGTNSIRVYHVSPYADHSGCMSIFASLGIYVWLDLDTFNTTIEQAAPVWSAAQLYAFTQVLDAFIGFSNLAGFWIGNEIINTAAGSPAAPFIKAAVSDIKSYMALKNYRAIPIGYSAADIAELRPSLQNYLACSPSQGSNIDFFGLNSYEWCGDSSYQTSGYSGLQDMSANYSIPIFFSETGCNVVQPRSFTDQAAIFGSDMRDTWSGSIIYEWVQETNDYGLVTYPGGGVSGQPEPIQPDFQNLASQWEALSSGGSSIGIAEAAYTPTFLAPPCPLASGGWLVNGDVPLPTLGPAVVAQVAASATAISVSTWTSFPTLTETVSVAATATVGVASAPGSAIAQTSPAGSSPSASGSANSQNGGSVLGERRLGTGGVLVLNVVIAAVLL